MGKHWIVTKERMVYVMGGECAICGYKRCNKALEFHHINPEEKDFTFSDNSSYKNWETICDELQKCILVCANCHREIHDGMIEGELETTFNAKRAEEVNQEIEAKKVAQKYYCKDCGVEIATNTGRCVECAAIHRRKTERPSREDLKILIRTTSFSAIARQFDVSDNAIRKWCISENLPSKVSDIKKISDDDWKLI